MALGLGLSPPTPVRAEAVELRRCPDAPAWSVPRDRGPEPARARQTRVVQQAAGPLVPDEPQAGLAAG